MISVYLLLDCFCLGKNVFLLSFDINAEKHLKFML